MTKHHYQLHLRWTGNTGKGTSNYTAYGRDYEAKVNCAIVEQHIEHVGSEQDTCIRESNFNRSILLFFEKALTFAIALEKSTGGVAERLIAPVLKTGMGS